MSERIIVDENRFEAEVTNCQLPILVDFYTPTCGPCKSLAVILEKFEKSMEGQVKVVAVNAEESPDLAQRLGVRGVPTLMLFHEGRLVGTQTGVLLPPQLRQWMVSSLPAGML